MPDQNTRATTKRIAIIDDDADMIDLLTAYLKPRGYSVECFNDAETALESSKTDLPPWDVVLSDLNLPGKSGIDFTVEFKNYHQNVPVILITTNRNAETALSAVEKGVYDFIVKPIHFPQLQISIERAFQIKNITGDLSELRQQIKRSKEPAQGIIGKSPKFLNALEVAKRVAPSKANIFISGESGTGKEVIAKFIHKNSSVCDGPFIAINCSAIPENLLESELFGHAKGAFTGAIDKKLGLFEEAEKGTLFLDEIGDLSPSLQAKLLRVLQERKIKRVGENQYRVINCRIISATHKNLLQLIKENLFREDLYFRLNVIPISIPPLRERKEDLLPLAEHFLRKFSAENNSAARIFSKNAAMLILDSKWPGNVRELENTIERASVLARGNAIEVEDLHMFHLNDQVSILPKNEVFEELPQDLVTDENPSDYSNMKPLDLRKTFDIDSKIPSSTVTEHIENPYQFTINCSDQLLTLEALTQKYIEFAVEINDGAKDKTAKILGIDRKTLYKKLKSDKLTESPPPSFS